MASDNTGQTKGSICLKENGKSVPTTLQLGQQTGEHIFCSSKMTTHLNCSTGTALQEPCIKLSPWTDRDLNAGAFCV